MRIEKIIVILEEIVYSFRGVLLVRIISREFGKFFVYRIGIHGITPVNFQFLHHLSDESGVPVAELEKQSLEIGAHENVHRRRHRLMEGTVDVVFPVVEKVGKHVVDVACDDEFVYRKPHSLCVISRENVAEIPRGHHEVDGFALVYLSRSEKVEIRRNVIHYLRREPAPVDGVGGGEGISELLEFLFRLLARENTFDRGLRVVEIAFDAYDVDILACGGLHLQFLHRADAFGRVNDHYFRAFDVLKAFERCFTGVARSRHENERFV